MPATRVRPLVGLLGTALVAAGAWSSPRPASASEPEPDAIRLSRSIDRAPPSSFSWRIDPASGWALQYARQLEWNQRLLTEVPRVDEGLNYRDGLEAPSPRAWSTMATAISRLAARGLPVIERRRDLKVRQRHALLAYFRSRGVNFAWRVQF